MFSKHYALCFDELGEGEPLNAELEFGGQGCGSTDKVLDSLQNPAFDPQKREPGLGNKAENSSGHMKSCLRKKTNQ